MFVLARNHFLHALMAAILIVAGTSFNSRAFE
jgi:hypothetical protein